jgi:hypothetical protein
MNAARKQFGDLHNKLKNARGMVFACAKALDAGETDLELSSARALLGVSEQITDCVDELNAIRLSARRRACQKPQQQMT